MDSSLQERLLQHLLEHQSEYQHKLRQWNLASEQYTNYKEAQVQRTAIRALLQASTIELCSLDNEHLLYARSTDVTNDAPVSLLLVLPLASSFQQSYLILQATLATLALYRQLASTVPVQFTWLFYRESEQEDEHRYSIAEYSHILKATGCIWYMTNTLATSATTLSKQSDQQDMNIPLFLLGNKGYLHVELDTETASRALPSAYGAIVPNAAWRLLWALQSLKDAGEDILLPGFYDAVVPVADEVVELLHTLPDTAQFLVRQVHDSHLLFDLHGFRLHYAHHLLPTCTLTQFESGTDTDAEKRLIPPRASAQVAFQLVPEQDPHDIFQKLQTYLHGQGFQDIQLRLHSAQNPMYTPVDHPFVQHLRRATRRAYGYDPYILPLSADNVNSATYVMQTILRQQLAMPVVIAMLDNETQMHEAMQHTYVVSIMRQFITLIGELDCATNTIE